MEHKQPKFIDTYLCAKCNREVGFSDLDEPLCRVCDESTDMTFVSRERITPELIAAKLKASSDRMVTAMEEAFDLLQQEGPSKDPDEEIELQQVLERVRKLREQIQNLELRNPEKQ